MAIPTSHIPGICPAAPCTRRVPVPPSPFAYNERHPALSPPPAWAASPVQTPERATQPAISSLAAMRRVASPLEVPTEWEGGGCLLYVHACGYVPGRVMRLVRRWVWAAAFTPRAWKRMWKV